MKIGFYLFFLMVAFVSLSAKCAPLNEFLDVYLGADAQKRIMKYQNGYGARMLSTHSPQGNLYVGVHLNKKFAVELGYESTVANKKTISYFANGERVNGMAVPSTANHIVFETKAKIEGPHLSLVYFERLGPHSPWKFFVGVGVCEVKGVIERESVAICPPMRGRLRTFCKRCTAVRLSSGIQYNFDNNFSVRGTLSFANTRNMQFKPNDGQQGVGFPIFKTRDTLTGGLGGLYSF